MLEHIKMDAKILSQMQNVPYINNSLENYITKYLLYLHYAKYTLYEHIILIQSTYY